MDQKPSFWEIVGWVAAAATIGVLANVGKAMQLIPPPAPRVIWGMCLSSVAAAVVATLAGVAFLPMAPWVAADMRLPVAGICGMVAGAVGMLVFQRTIERVVRAGGEKVIKAALEAPPEA
ncbi:MAG: hypothetical protein ACRC2U_09735 [Aeromonas sp.]